MTGTPVSPGTCTIQNVRENFSFVRSTLSSRHVHYRMRILTRVFLVSKAYCRPTEFLLAQGRTVFTFGRNGSRWAGKRTRPRSRRAEPLIQLLAAACAAATHHSCKYRWLHAPATKISSSRGQNGDNPVTTQGRSASRRQAKRSAFVLPAHFQSSPEFFVGHVQVALRLLDAGVSEQQLNDADVDAVGE